MRYDKPMHTLRMRFGKGLVSEFLPPKRKSRRVIVLCDGMPTVPSKRSLLEKFSKLGYWAFHPRYAGTWESAGVFLKRSPHEDVLSLIDQLPKGFASEWDGSKMGIESPNVILLGSSFGGTVALLCSRHPSVSKVIALSPETDWREEGEAEPVDWLFDFLKRAFGMGYRTAPGAARKLKSGKFFNLWHERRTVEAGKCLVVHAKDDEVVSPKATRRFCREIGCRLIEYKRGGHMGLSFLLTKRGQKLFKEHLRKK
jgi:pimeloyl-ACP methyl ester carboxylesterase